jgi:hypothetical protein
MFSLITLSPVSKISKSTDWRSTRFLLTACTTRGDANLVRAYINGFHDQAFGTAASNASKVWSKSFVYRRNTEGNSFFCGICASARRTHPRLELPHQMLSTKANMWLGCSCTTTLHPPTHLLFFLIIVFIPLSISGLLPNRFEVMLSSVYRHGLIGGPFPYCSRRRSVW